MDNVKYRRIAEEDVKDSQPKSEDEEEASDRPKSSKTKSPYSWCIMALKVTSVLVFLIVIGAVIIPYVWSAPLHAQCAVTW